MSVHFENVTQADIDDLSSKKTAALPLEFLGLGELRQLDIDTAGALIGLQETIQKQQKKIDALDSGLRAEIKSQRIAAIKADHAEKLEFYAAKIAEGDRVAKEQFVFWERPTYLLRVKFSDSDPDGVKDAQIRMAWMTRLPRLHHGALLAIARFAVAKRDLPVAAVLTEEVNFRTDLPRPLQTEILTMLGTIPAPCDEAAAIFGRLRLRQAQAVAAATGDRTGLGVASITAGLMAMNVKPLVVS